MGAKENDPYAQLMASGLEINWCTLLAGWEGLGSFGRLVSVREIIEFACQYLNDRESPINTRIASLAALRDDEDEETITLLNELARETGCNLQFEERKWRLILVRQLLASLPEEPLDALLKLGEFWDNSNLKNGPHIIQGVDNDLAPVEYYSRKTLETLIERHRRWIVVEYNALKPAE